MGMPSQMKCELGRNGFDKKHPLAYSCTYMFRLTGKACIHGGTLMIRTCYQHAGLSKSGLLFLCIFLIGISVFGQDADVTKVHSEIALSAPSDSKLAEAEQEAIKLMGERWRIRHEAEYNDPEIARIRVMSKEAEKDLVELRRQFHAHMRTHYPEIRTMEKEVRDVFSRIKVLRQDEDAEIGEQRVAEAGGLVVSSGTGDQEQRLARLKSDIAETEQAARAARSALEARRKELAQGDEAASAMLKEIKAIETELEESVRRMNALVDERPAVIEHEAVRVRQMSHVHDLRKTEQSLEKVGDGF